ncbi:protein FAM234B isoform X2 [Rhinatrema bivittatum]|uniref:protein FAM234B isoform X2 n=1 Tax=Rhinatrema bivittatum TaxID=194408 RepID=UPI0011296DE4|nr:protein FAM234B isoform X2 [Rhinatrema bivittatum]
MRFPSLSSMATVLSRALKLPGKKSHDLGEYDPLTQADSDESEDDLVLNVQKNGGGVKNGKSPLGAAQDLDSDVEAGLPKASQWPGASKLEAHPVALGGAGLEQKARAPVWPYVRTALFLLTVVISMVLVLVCAFLIPCPMRDEHNTWSLTLGQQKGMLSPLELFDVNNDGVPDILLSFTIHWNNSAQGVPKLPVSVVALSGRNGRILWATYLHEEVRSIQCEMLVPATPKNATCLLTGASKLLRMVNASSGKLIWTLSPAHVPSGTMAAPALILPDLDGDGIGDLVVLTSGERQSDLSFLLVSGRSGKPLGGPVKYSIMGEGKLIGPQAYLTSRGAIYILLGFGNVQAVALRDIFVQAKNRDNFPHILQAQEPEWEKRRSINLSELIDVYSEMEFLQSVKVPASNFSDILITTKEGVSLLRGQDLEPRWTLQLKNIQSEPTPGYFTDDQNLDFMLQAQSRNGTKMVLVIDGKSGSAVWSSEVPWRRQPCLASSVMTTDRRSAFLFWGEETQPGVNSSEQVTRVEPQGRQHLYLLHPSYPMVVLDLTNITATVTASAIGVNEAQKNAFYVTMTTEQVHGASQTQPKPLLVSKLGLRWALAHSRAEALEKTPLKTNVGEVKRFLSRLKFISPLKF